MRRPLIVLVLGLVLLGAAVSPAGAHGSLLVDDTTSSSTIANGSTTESLPGTTLEADARDDGTSPAPWLIGSGIAAAVAVAVGGSLLKRRVS